MSGSDCRSAGVSPAGEPSGSPLRGWHSRGYLPHFDAGETQSVTFRLRDSLPAAVLDRILEHLQGLRESDLPAATREEHLAVERTLDRGFGSCLLRGRAGQIVEDGLLFFDGDRYRLHAWCVMPNHVHVLFTPSPTRSMSDIVHSWKSYTAHKINRLLGRSGSLWEVDYYDRYIRNEEHYWNALTYIEQNPVAARLCDHASEWVVSSARHQIQSGNAGETPALRQREE